MSGDTNHKNSWLLQSDFLMHHADAQILLVAAEKLCPLSLIGGRGRSLLLPSMHSTVLSPVLKAEKPWTLECKSFRPPGFPL